MEDLYKTIESPTEGLFKDKGSKFIAYAYPVFTEDEIKEHLQRIKKEHFSARITAMHGGWELIKNVFAPTTMENLHHQQENPY